MRYLVAVILLFISSAVFAQTDDNKLVQFSGVVYNIDSNTVVPYVTIYSTSRKNITYSSNYMGYFSFVARERDTIVFSSIGYRREAIVIPEASEDHKYSVIVKMKQESVSLPAVFIFPWASIDEFNRDFMNMKVADDDFEIARKNVSREKLFAGAQNLPRDGGEMQSLNFQNNHIRLTNQNMNMRAQNPLLNPFAWSSLIQQIIKGDQSRNND